jgi:hypothetical protein
MALIFQQTAPPVGDGAMVVDFSSNIRRSSAVAPRHHVQMRPAHFFNDRLRHANVGEQPVVKFEKLPVLASSFPREGYSGEPRKRDFPGPSKVRKSGGSCAESVG